MKKWEYRIAYLAHRGHDSGYVSGPMSGKLLWEQDLEKSLNKLGAEGWELVSFPHELLDDNVDGFALFKRPIEQEGI